MMFLLYIRLLFSPIQALCVYKCFTSPTAPPPSTEQEKYSVQNTFQIGERGFTVVHAMTIFIYMSWMINVLEFGTLLTTLTSTPTAPFIYDLEVLSIKLAHNPALFCVPALLAILGTILRISAYRYLGHLFTYQLSVRRDHQLVTSGPYRIVRHPSYSGGALFLIGSIWCQLGPVSVWTHLGLWRNTFFFTIGSAQILLSVYAVFVAAVLRVGREDKILREEFGEEWDNWAKRTPYKIIPFIF